MDRRTKPRVHAGQRDASDCTGYALYRRCVPSRVAVSSRHLATHLRASSTEQCLAHVVQEGLVASARIDSYSFGGAVSKATDTLAVLLQTLWSGAPRVAACGTLAARTTSSRGPGIACTPQPSSMPCWPRTRGSVSAKSWWRRVLRGVPRATLEFSGGHRVEWAASAEHEFVPFPLRWRAFSCA